MEATPKEAITPEAIVVRQVTHYRTSWAESDAGAPGVFRFNSFSTTALRSR
jgi:hypothetical protein